MAKACGKLFLVKIEDPGNPGMFIEIGGIQSNTLSINDEAVDVTDKGAAGWRELKAGCGILQMALSGAGFITDSAGFKEAKAKFLAQTHVLMEVTSDIGDSYEGTFQIVSIERGGEYNGAETLSLSLESAGVITYTPIP